MTCSYMNESRNYENNQIIITFNEKAGYDAKLVCLSTRKTNDILRKITYSEINYFSLSWK
jgi:hypothetical protein